ncbi:MAG TPA: transposase [Lysobacter sp.]
MHVASKLAPTRARSGVRYRVEPRRTTVGHDKPSPTRTPGTANRQGLCPCQIYLVTVVTDHRAVRFRDCAPAWAVSAVLHDNASWRDASDLAWVLMPDHWHALVQLGESSTLSTVMQRAKSISARAANRASGRSGQVWQPAFHDHALRSEEDLLAFARYLVANPVRAGLVRSVRNYPFWNAVWL